MTHRSAASRTLRVDQLARVEGEGALHVELTDGAVTDVRLRIFEPPRFFEGFLVGRSHMEPPDITARICGICPVAYQMSACLAVEDACGVQVGGVLEDLRRLLYCGEWIESHTLHISMLHAPDFLGVPSAIELAEIDRPTVERALRLKKAGNRILETIGGRAIHPVNVKVGGFHRLVRREELAGLAAALEDALEDSLAVTRWVAGFTFPDVEMDYRFVVADDPGNYPVLGAGFIIDGAGDSRGARGGGPGTATTPKDPTGATRYPSAEFTEEVIETHVRHSTALHAHLRSGDGYLVGPLARFAMASQRLHPLAREAAAEAGLSGPVRNPFRSIVVRAVEVVHAVATALELIESLAASDLNGAPSVPVDPPSDAPVLGHGITEAPRGLLYHRYRIDPAGDITEATIIPPTSQNQPTIEHDLWHVAEDMLTRGAHPGDPGREQVAGDGVTDDELRHRCEVAIRNHDPCISCATHFLDLTVDRRQGS